MLPYFKNNFISVCGSLGLGILPCSWEAQRKADYIFLLFSGITLDPEDEFYGGPLAAYALAYH